MAKKKLRKTGQKAEEEKGEGVDTQTAGRRHLRRSARLTKEETPKLVASASADAVIPPACGSPPTSSSDEESNEASETLLSMKRGLEKREWKRRRSPKKEFTSKKNKRDAVGDIRPSARFGSYCIFMHKLHSKMKNWHWDALKGTNFEHYVFFGPPARDRRALEHVLSHYDAETDEFSFPDPRIGSLISVKFDEEWVQTHTGFPIDGELIYGNRDPHNRLWREYFEDKKEMLKDKEKAKARATEEPGSMRKYIEELLETLVESSDDKDVEDFVLLQILYQCSMI